MNYWETQRDAARQHKLSQINRGQGDATAAKIYSDIYSKDPEFYEFW